MVQQNVTRPNVRPVHSQRATDNGTKLRVQGQAEAPQKWPGVRPAAHKELLKKRVKVCEWRGTGERIERGVNMGLEFFALSPMTMVASAMTQGAQVCVAALPAERVQDARHTPETRTWTDARADDRQAPFDLPKAWCEALEKPSIAHMSRLNERGVIARA